ncbi:hypothetical protein ACFU5O_09590 [Streptomyces sp. NPDC057445]|uniref:hypothetical protein n=1 Tax=Streptomyces sp. NPDC057445 TaxID=3346136 RepID=UPI0036CD0E2C
MGFWGYYLVGRGERPLAEQDALARVRSDLVLHSRRPGGWQVWRAPSEPDLGDMGALARSAGVPVLFGFVMDSACVAVEGAAPGSGSWYACLARENMAGFLATGEMTLDDLYPSPEDAARLAAEWAAEAGAGVETGPLREILRAPRPEPIAAGAEELFFGFLQRLGIPDESGASVAAG